METRHGLRSLPIEGDPAVATIGFFDGVHRGHQAVFNRTMGAARERGLRSAVVTFDRHPREVLTPGKEPRLLTTLARKASLIEAAGIDLLVVLEFTEEFSRWPAEEFVRVVLSNGLRTAHVVVGSNFTFGHRALGTIETLRALGPDHGFTAEEVPLLVVDGRPVSSSSIREALADGDLDWPFRALGRRYAVDGTVVSGAGRGAGLGFPTANLQIDPRIQIPASGIYAGRATAGGATFVAALSVGTNPTFGGDPLHVEAFLLDFEGELRGESLSVEFWARLRAERRFDSPAELVQAMEDDVRRTRELVPSTEARPA